MTLRAPDPSRDGDLLHLHVQSESSLLDGLSRIGEMTQRVRWFTDEAYEAGEDAWKALLASYEAHATALADSLPPDLAALATDPGLNLHDARIRRIGVDPDRATVRMTVVLGDGRQLRLSVGDATFVPDNLQAVAYAVGATYTTDHWGTTRTQILAHEVDADRDGRYLLRLRLWPFGEFGLAFSSLSLAEESETPDDGGPGVFVFEDEAEAR